MPMLMQRYLMEPASLVETLMRFGMQSVLVVQGGLENASYDS
ncbi:MAG: hypothetical protein RL693_2690 [Verrucomicrobiota bacterium]